MMDVGGLVFDFEPFRTPSRDRYQRRSIMRRQKMKMGTCSALRKIAFTVGKEETDQFQKQQDELAEHSRDAVSIRGRLRQRRP